jgi:predicted RNA-binding Zn-ribbon protein involved in translation (DUF1610 family)
MNDFSSNYLPDYSNYSVWQLEDVLRHIDKAKYPDRVTLIEKELLKKREKLKDTLDEKRVAELKGVGGWLFFFVLSAVIFSPIYFIYGFIKDYKLFEYFFNSIGVIFIILLLLEISLLVYKIFIGVIIYKIRPDAVEKAYVFFKISIIYYTINLLINIVNKNPHFLIASKISTINISLILAILGNILWWIYFKKSERVKNTFGEERKIVTCSSCNEEIEIVRKEIVEGKFICPNCNQTVLLNKQV